MRPCIKDAFDRFSLYGGHTGDFVGAVLRNDFVAAVCGADEYNLADIRAIALYVHNHVPAPAWKSDGAMNEWRKTGGYVGRYGARAARLWADDENVSDEVRAGLEEAIARGGS